MRRAGRSVKVIDKRRVNQTRRRRGEAAAEKSGARGTRIGVVRGTICSPTRRVDVQGICWPMERPTLSPSADGCSKPMRTRSSNRRSARGRRELVIRTSPTPLLRWLPFGTSSDGARRAGSARGGAAWRATYRVRGTVWVATVLRLATIPISRTRLSAGGGAPTDLCRHKN